MEKADLIRGEMTPEEAGINSLDVLECIRALDETENEVHGFVAARYGRIFAESYLAPYAKDIPHTCHSLGKSYTCTAVGIACTEGLLSPDDRVVDLFAGEIAAFSIAPDDNMRKIKLRDVMSMSSGMERMPDLNETWLENYLKSPVRYTPGTQFLYNSVGSCLLGAAVEKATGMSLDEYLRARLFSLIGICDQEIVWRRFANGYCAEPGLCATTRANLRLGLFYLAEGCVDGCQIVSRDWMQKATTKQIETGIESMTDDGSMGYGWQLWMSRIPGLYRFDGGQGQFCLIYPKKELVVAIHEGGKHPSGVQKVLDIVQGLMESASDDTLPPDPDGYAELKACLGDRALKPADSSQIPAKASKIFGTYLVTQGVFNPWIEVAPVDKDFYHLFYDPSVQSAVSVLQIELENDVIVLTLNQKTILRARLDGCWMREETFTVMPPLSQYSAVARMEDETILHISLRWLNSWCCPNMRFALLNDSDLEIHIEKDMLHEGRSPFMRTAIARRIR